MLEAVQVMGPYLLYSLGSTRRAEWIYKERCPQFCTSSSGPFSSVLPATEGSIVYPRLIGPQDLEMLSSLRVRVRHTKEVVEKIPNALLDIIHAVGPGSVGRLLPIYDLLDFASCQNRPTGACCRWSSFSSTHH